MGEVFDLEDAQAVVAAGDPVWVKYCVIGWSGPSTRRQRPSVSSPRARAGSASPSHDQGAGQRGRRQQGDRVVRAEHPAAALQRVLAQGAGRLRLAQPESGRGSVRPPPAG